MSVSVDAGGTAGRKSLSSDLNLVPYIDLLTCMVTFLLITAVWTQLARIAVTQKGESRDGPSTASTPTRLVVVIDDEGFTVGGTGPARRLAKADGRYDLDRLLAVLKEVKRALPDKRDIQIASADGVAYEHVVQTMDTALAADFPDVALTDLAAAHL